MTSPDLSLRPVDFDGSTCSSARPGFLTICAGRPSPPPKMPFGASSVRSPLHDRKPSTRKRTSRTARSEEHTSELQSQSNLVCRLLLEKKSTIAEDSPRPDFHTA